MYKSTSMKYKALPLMYYLHIHCTSRKSNINVLVRVHNIILLYIICCALSYTSDVISFVFFPSMLCSLFYCGCVI